ncbi:hypothetical protein BDGGKGIB_00107 [Nodularia sphaerocarpa UHCC 0038]|nr:hypothetical protein BDGGKGIB_00107 [Nodularia sphaerocarpa UHCC 0038]
MLPSYSQQKRAIILLYEDVKTDPGISVCVPTITIYKQNWLLFSVRLIFGVVYRKAYATH